MGKINARASVSDFNMPKPLKWRKNHEQVADAITGVLTESKRRGLPMMPVKEAPECL